MPDYTDDELLEMFRNSDQQHYAFNLLVKKYRQKAYFFARRIVISHEDADDVVQNVFIKVWNHLHKFRQDAALSTWLYRIIVNESLSVLNSRKLNAFLSLTSPEAQSIKMIHDDPYFTGDELQKRLRVAVARLPRKQQLVFNMRYFDELSYDEISQILGTSVGALKASYHFAVKKIEDSITGD